MSDTDRADRGAGTVLRSKIDCRDQCDIPAGVELVDVPPPRHAWSDVIRCPNTECGRFFLVIRRTESGDIRHGGE